MPSKEAHGKVLNIIIGKCKLKPQDNTYYQTPSEWLKSQRPIPQILMRMKNN